MIQSAALILLFCAIIAGVRRVSRLPAAAKVFRYLPVPLWCYFIPTALASMKLIPSDAPVYGETSGVILPACLLLLLWGSDVPTIARAGGQALFAMGLGSITIGVGCAVSFAALLKMSAHSGFSPAALAQGWGSLSASWTGGSINMVAVREILQTPESLFSNLIITDAFIAYSWMAVLVISSQYQERFDRGMGLRPLDETLESAVHAGPAEPGHFWRRAALAAAALAAGQALWGAAKIFPAGPVLNRFTWTVILATILPLLLSSTPARRLREWGTEETGTFLLYLLLTSVGARADLSSISAAPYFIVAGILWIAVHGALMLALGRLFRIPLSLLATSSQANVGGTVSAPLVAGVYSRQLAPVAVILAVCGNIYGTYFGLLMARICSALANLI